MTDGVVTKQLERQEILDCLQPRCPKFRLRATGVLCRVECLRFLHVPTLHGPFLLPPSRIRWDIGNLGSSDGTSTGSFKDRSREKGRVTPTSDRSARVPERLSFENGRRTGESPPSCPYEVRSRRSSWTVSPAGPRPGSGWESSAHRRLCNELKRPEVKGEDILLLKLQFLVSYSFVSVVRILPQTTLRPS